MRRLFIIRRDLNLSTGKLAAMVAHCAEAYWTNLLKLSPGCRDGDGSEKRTVSVPGVVWDEYVEGSFVKTILEARNKTRLLKAVDMALELGLVEGMDFGLIRDNCLTELEPEDPDGRTTVGAWFAPLPDDKAHAISRKFQLMRDHRREECVVGEGEVSTAGGGS